MRRIEIESITRHHGETNDLFCEDRHANNCKIDCELKEIHVLCVYQREYVILDSLIAGKLEL